LQNLESVSAPFCRIVYEDLNLNSHEQVKNFLLSQGWEPTQWNRVREEDGTWRTTSPKLTEDSYASIKGDLGRLVAKRNILVHRRRFIQNYDDPENKGILGHVRADGRIAATGVLCNTPTGRTTHRGAACNVPKASEKVPYGREIRSLYSIRDKENFILLGADLVQIEALITAHYSSLYDGGEYWRRLQEVKDIHTYNAKTIGRDRDTAKSFQYALFYGAQAPKLASIIGCTVKEAEDILKKFWDENMGIYHLIKNLEEQYNEMGFIVGLDGRKLHIRAKYKLLNSLIQTGAGIIWKKWGCLANKRLRESLIDCTQIIAYHDEYEYRCEKIAVPLARSIISTSAVDAGLYFNLKVPISVDIKEGYTWAEVH